MSVTPLHSYKLQESSFSANARSTLMRCFYSSFTTRGSLSGM